ncbi:MAG: hypothetical protein Ta2D_06150 [Rickettsiales bacterium]|nr:MAG: hypothetical protein Ta2D_06150 [Rickettsiales bacterium]
MNLLYKRNLYFSFVFAIILLFFVLPVKFDLFWLVILYIINISFLIVNFIKSVFYIIGFFTSKDKYEPITNFPIYTILLPVKKESYLIMEQLFESIYNLDYPKDKLDIKLIVDADDEATIEIAKNITNYKFELVIVPEAKYKTKPLSCNYALQFAKGEYTTIYDAEDVPFPEQLKMVVYKFSKLSADFICIQCPLNYYNNTTNFLTFCFSAEYSMWFDYTMKGINKIATFFPLGGNSNHFKTKELKEIGAWDGYNVTEDAELGVRIAKSGYKISYTDSKTLEECPTKAKDWLKQRSRWFKGFIQTFLEHIIYLKPKTIESKMKFKGIFSISKINSLIFLTFLLFSFLSFILSTSMLFIAIFKSAKYTIPPNLNFLIIFNIKYFFAMIYIANIIFFFRYKYKLNLKNLLFLILSPLYWICHHIACLIAIYDLVFSPFYWRKTEHGKDKKYFKK